MARGVEHFPFLFRELAASPPEGFEISQRLLEPEILLEKSGDRFRAILTGTKTIKGEKKTWKATSPEANWVADGHTIHPLPHDIPSFFRKAIDGCDPDNLVFSQVVALMREADQEIPIRADDSVFRPAKAVADEEVGSQQIDGLNATLFPYQANGVSWMDRTIAHTGGLILADEMGLGKTIQIIALLLLQSPSTQHPALIICPTSLIANWRSEIFRFAPTLSILIHRGGKRTGVSSGLQRAQVVLSTYDTVVNDVAIFEGVEWSWLICDEAQALKNPDSGRRQHIARLPRQRTIPMTGTPVETSLLDLWSLADLAIPGLLREREVFEIDFPNTEDAARELAWLTDPVVLRREVKDVASDLPDRIDIDVPIDLGSRLATLYDEVLDNTLEKYPTAGALVATGQLQLFCAHPWLQYEGGDAKDAETALVRSSDKDLLTPKIERTTAILKEAFAARKKVLIFAIFNRCGEIIREAADRQIPEAYWGAINGSTPQEERQKIVNEFSAHEGPGCLVLNPKAAGAGLNITAATIVIHYTQSWNPALEKQASARAHRRGQTEPVYIYRLFYEHTVERVMIDRSEWRKALGNEAVPVSTRDSDDLKRALSIRPGGTE
ncbi:DEAD/DEAH box helicase [Alisedimentitalea sp. MJ-SS2]|uniref:DEAD/DEAH box helicase n=1 Tax=Aliisedimentitalea sp. MJ-SS2 TaxID=3049795 RepID=UPI0029069EDA|nr:DEAD/DEAH box helicase [Alisedimentitalea sp. MJ-SS2]MDU8927679.1 DEAD/DEAH box helicase [Alisedimentitalea sp. MJ-SS2]